MIEAPRLALANLPTPLQRLDRLSDRYGRGIWIKRDDLTGLAISGNKIRKLEYSLAEARQNQANVIVTCGGIQSNHCRATAILGAQLGFRVHLLLRGEEPEIPDGNLFLDILAGAKISYFAKRYYQAHLDFIAEETCDSYRHRGDAPFFIPTGASDATGVWGYYRATQELLQDFQRLDIDTGHIVVATGSGGTQAGLTAGLAHMQARARCTGYAVCDDAQWFTNKVTGDIADWNDKYDVGLDPQTLQVNVRDHSVGQGYAIADKPVFELIARLLREEGLWLDPVYTAKAFRGMLLDLEEGYFEGSNDIVFVHTGGSFGLFAQRRECLSSLR